MPMYYSVVRSTTTVTAATRRTHVLCLTSGGATRRPVRAVGLYGSVRSGTAGGASLQLDQSTGTGTAGSGGTALNYKARSPWFASGTLIVAGTGSAITIGTSLRTHFVVGLAQTGGNGGWVALEPDHAPYLKTGGGVNGNLEVASFANAASMTIIPTLEWSEGN